MTTLAESQRVRLIELSLVVGVAFFGSILVSIDALTGGPPPVLGENLASVSFIAHELLCLCLLAYILFRQGKSWKDLGFSFSPKDLIVSLGLVLWSVVAYWLAYQALYAAYSSWFGTPSVVEYPNIMDQGALVFLLPITLINPLYEESIVRAFVISEVESIWHKRVLAVIVSVCLQTAYHLYQGPINALSLSVVFTIWSIYYLQSRKIWPVILSHFAFDAYALWQLI